MSIAHPQIFFFFLCQHPIKRIGLLDTRDHLPVLPTTFYKLRGYLPLASTFLYLLSRAHGQSTITWRIKFEHLLSILRYSTGELYDEDFKEQWTPHMSNFSSIMHETLLAGHSPVLNCSRSVRQVFELLKIVLARHTLSSESSRHHSYHRWRYQYQATSPHVLTPKPILIDDIDIYHV